MMNIDTTYALYFLVASNALMIGAAAFAILRLQRMANGQNSFWKSPTGAALSSQADFGEVLRAIDHRFSELESSLSELSRDNTQDQQRPRLPFENAVRMAKHGASLDDLTRTCGLSETEAKLLMRVHGQQPVAATVN